MAERKMNFHSSILQVASIIKNKDQKKAKEKMDLEKKKRDRKANYSKPETERLVELVISKKDILENKKNNADLWSEKRETWEDIEREFNKKPRPGVIYRDAKTLRIKYESLKRDIKRKWNNVLANKKKPNGKMPRFSSAEKKIRDIISLPMEGFCDFDSIDDNKSEDDGSSDSSMSNSNIEDLDCSIVKNEITISEDETANFAYHNINLEEPLSKNMRDDPLVGSQHQRNDKSSVEKRVRLNQSVDSQNPGNIDINNAEDERMKLKLQLEVLQEELSIKKLQKKILEKELEHKETIHQLEKEHLLLKIKLLNNES